MLQHISLKIINVKKEASPYSRQVILHLANIKMLKGLSVGIEVWVWICLF